MSEETASALPYIQLLEGKDPVGVLKDTAERLARILDQLTPEQTEYRPAPGKWNVREIIAHLCDCEIAWSWRFRQILSEHNTSLQAFEQDAWAKVYGQYSLAQARETRSALRTWNLLFLAGLEEADKQRPAIHPQLGGITLWTAAGIAAGHDLHHLHSLEHVAAKL